ncbi:Detected protein of confused Function [Hibiscus syriacus]|uniref:Detected protein of confused Function n=1 Tax=Hibiscus syriacus TaxID=106335 RepID=A0A6A2WA09_HIBSY|nr:Detected protein of confused Function [Hibiscus syriacus]
MTNLGCRYFETLQKELAPYDCVLYEMVASRESLENRRNPSAAKRLKSSRSRGFNILGCIQRQMARILMLDFQLDCLDYEADNWYILTTRPSSYFSSDSSIPEDLDPWRSKLQWASRVLPMPLVGFLIIRGVCADVGCQASDYPELEALSRLDFGAAMKETYFLNLGVAFSLYCALDVGSYAFLFTQENAEVEERSVIIGERNRAATEALRRAINDGNNKIAILYGGGHMPDLGRRLKEEFDLVPSRVQWVTVWSITKQDFQSSSLPFLKTMAEVSGWPLNRYQTLALLIISSVLALDLWFWELFCGTALNWISEIASAIAQYAGGIGSDRDDGESEIQLEQRLVLVVVAAKVETLTGMGSSIELVWFLRDEDDRPSLGRVITRFLRDEDIWLSRVDTAPS